MKIILVSLIIFAAGVSAQESTDIKPGYLARKMIEVRDAQNDAVEDMVFDGYHFQQKIDGDGNITEKKEYRKKHYIAKIDDSLHVYEQYLEFMIDGEIQSAEETAKEAAKRREEKEKRGARDLGYDFTIPLRMVYTGLYDLSYDGIADEPIDGYICYMLRCTAREENDSLINCLYYVDTASYHTVRVEFSPAKLVNVLVFKLSELSMAMNYKKYDDIIWVPHKFEINGRGKAAFFISVNFSGGETYSNPVINGGVDSSLFLMHDN